MIDKGLSLRWRMILIVAGIPLLFLIPVMVFVGGRYRTAYREAFWSKADLTAEQLAQTINAVSSFIVTVEDAPGLNQHLRRIIESDEDFQFVVLVDRRGRVIEHSNPGFVGRAYPEFRNLEADAIRRTMGEDGQPRGISLRDLPDERLYLVWRAMEMPGNRSEPLYIVIAERATTVNPPVLPLAIVALVAAVGLVLLIRLSLQRLVLRPLNTLAEGAAIVGAGDLAHRIRLDREDEFGFVARSFNEMTARLDELVTRLEQRVAERTEALERRNAQLEAVSTVGQEAARERNVAALLETAATAVSEKFGFYHTGIFILDDDAEWAILGATSSEGGRRMLNRGHRLAVGQVGIVGYVAATGKPRVAFNVGQDEIWFSNPDLPETQSEMALPLVVEDRVIGVLDVQSDEQEAFSDEDISTLQLMADQLTVALNNARALETMESALAELRELQVDYGRRGWARVTQRMRPQAYEYDRVDTTPVPPLPVPADLSGGEVAHRMVMDGGAPVVMEALRVGDQVLGYLGLSDSQRAWSKEELALVRSVGEQIALALDNARLFEDTQRNERQQYLISSVLQVASNPDLSAEQILMEIARVLAQGLDMAVTIFTFPYANVPVVHAHAMVGPDGVQLALFQGDLPLSQEHDVFFRGLREPELGPMTPLLHQVATGADKEMHHLLSQYNFDRVLYIPITSAGEHSGFIGMIQTQENPPLDPATRDLAQNLASQIGVVLDNLHLSEETHRRSEELRQLYRLSLSLSEILEPTEVLEVTVAQGAQLLNADGANLWLYEPESGELVLEFEQGGGAEGRMGHRMAADEGLAGRALTEQRTLFVEDYAGWEFRVPELVSTRFCAMMAVPLIGRFGPLGVLVALSELIAAFGEREAGLADLFSAQAATALENARLTQDAQRRAEEFSQLYEAGIDLITILDAGDLLARAADWARRVFDAERAVVFLRDPETGRYVRGASVSDERYVLSQTSDRPSPRGFTETIIDSRESRLVADNRGVEMPGAQRLVEIGLLSQMGTPLRVGDDVLGALLVNGAEAYQFEPRDLDLLEFLATQVSSALQNSIQFEQTEQALATVGRQARYQQNVSEAVARLNDQGAEAVDDVLRLLGEAAGISAVLYFETREQRRESYWHLASIWLGNEPSPDRLQGAQLQPTPVTSLPFWHQTLEDQGFVMAKASEVPSAERRLLTMDGFGAILGLAVPGEADAPGFIALFTEEGRLWDEQEVVALQTVAAALSNTLARERLFRRVQQTLSETEALYLGGAALSEASSYEGILEVLLEHTVLGQDAQHATLHLFDRPWSSDVQPDHSDIVAYWSVEPDAEIQRRYLVDKFPSSGAIMWNTGPLFVENLAQDTMLDRRAKALLQRVVGAGSMVIVPLTVGGQRIGFLHADYDQPHDFSQDERRRLMSLSQQAAIAVLNIRQLRATEARVRREQLIRQISGRIQEAPDVQGVLQTAVRELGRAFGTSRNRIQFWATENSEGGVPKLEDGHGRGNGSERDARHDDGQGNGHANGHGDDRSWDTPIKDTRV